MFDWHQSSISFFMDNWVALSLMKIFFETSQYFLITDRKAYTKMQKVFKVFQKVFQQLLTARHYVLWMIKIGLLFYKPDNNHNWPLKCFAVCFVAAEPLEILVGYAVTVKVTSSLLPPYPGVCNFLPRGFRVALDQQRFFLNTLPTLWRVSVEAVRMFILWVILI